MSGGSADTVSYPYLRNMVGMDVDDESMKCVPHAKGELYLHVSTKFAQAGAILGGLIGSGLGAIRQNLTVVKGLTSGSRNGMLIGVPTGLIAVYMVMNGLKKSDDVDMDYAFYDRSYRLRHNRNQVRVDRSAYAGLGIGVAAAAASGASLLNGTAAGLVAGTVVGGVYNMAISKRR